MDNFIFDHWQNRVTKINCGSMSPNYACEILNISHCQNEISTFKIIHNINYCECLNKEIINFYQYLSIYYFYTHFEKNNIEPCYEHLYLFDNINLSELIIYYKKSVNIFNFILKDFSTNYEKYKQESLIKYIIE